MVSGISEQQPEIRSLSVVVSLIVLNTRCSLLIVGESFKQ